MPAVKGSQTATLLQRAAQKANSVPGKGVAVAAAATQARKRPCKAISNKPPPSVVAKEGRNKVLSGKPEAASPSQALKGQSAVPGSVAQKAADADASSSSSESEEENTSTAVKTPTPKPGKKARNACRLCGAFMNRIFSLAVRLVYAAFQLTLKLIISALRKRKLFSVETRGRNKLVTLSRVAHLFQTDEVKRNLR